MQPPLSERLRPHSIEEVIGQTVITGKNSWLETAMRANKPRSILLYGPPGCGKTTIARLYARSFTGRSIFLSAVNSGVAEIKKILQEKDKTPLLTPQTILFLDEIHRFNRAQQDLFLPFIEDGSLILIGATTENPSFSLNNALLSRLRILTLSPLDKDALNEIIQRYETSIKLLHLPEESRNLLIQFADGDGRHLLNLLENIEDLPPSSLNATSLKQFLQKKAPLYDKNQDGHYDLISSLHKSVRASDPDASIYWLCRMLNAGEDPLFLTRRLIRMSSEDIGLADPQALSVALDAEKAYRRLGSPEGELAIVQATIYLALAPKSNAAYLAYSRAQKFAEETSNAAPSNISINAPTKLMKEQKRGEGYEYDHDNSSGCSGQNHFPKGISPQSFYAPVDRGFERDMKKRLEYFSKIRKSTS